MMPRRRIEARDRRGAAVHEAGHFVVARYCGLQFVTARIWRHAVADFRNENTWHGQIRYAEWEMRELPLMDRTMVAVAGAVAEHAWSRSIEEIDWEEIDWEEIDWEEIDWEEREVMSPTDWALAELPPGEPTDLLYEAADKVTALLLPGDGPLWSQLCTFARELIC